MIVYGRPKRGIERDGYSDSGCHDVSDGFEHSLSREGSQSQDIFTFSTQESSNWSFDSELRGAKSSREDPHLAILPAGGNWVSENLENENDVSWKLKKGITRKVEEKKLGSKKLKSKGSRSACDQLDVSTTTLMETQEFGEIMEHMDEVNFALDGLKKGQPVRIRRASLLSLISICGSHQQRRLLRTHGLAKTIIDAVFVLNFDDSPSNLAAAALFYIFTSDCQDDQLLDSESSIQFLLKLLKPVAYASGNKRTPNIGWKLLAFRKNAEVLQNSGKELDSTTSAITLKVQELLVNCKEMKSGTSDTTRKPELSPKWMALFTIEKACLTTISLEDTTGAVRKTGGKFKERLRELGGLDAVFDVIQNCHSALMRWLKQVTIQNQQLKGSLDLESLALLLKCLRINENATFLSENNQNHLLGLRGSFDHEGFPESFVGLIISIIKILSGISLSKSSLGDIGDKMFHDLSIGIEKDTWSHSKGNHKAENNEIITISSSNSSSSTEHFSQKSLSTSQDHQWLSSGKSGDSKTASGMTRTYVADSETLKIQANSSNSSSCSGTRSSVPRPFHNIEKGCTVIEISDSESQENSQDPFAFHEEEFKSSKWELLSGVKKPPKTLHNKELNWTNGIECQPEQVLSLVELSNEENHLFDVSSFTALDEDSQNLLDDCLLTAVKVLMNLTNDNPKGCDQIASCGGLETLSSLIADHFPSFTTSMTSLSEIKTIVWKSECDNNHQKEINLLDQELDLLVAILGLLVNLVEKDNHNRLKLVETIVPLTMKNEGIMERYVNVIPLLCSIFLAYQREGNAGEEEKTIELDNEEALMRGAKEAEKMIVEAYAALLLAFLSVENKATRNTIAQCLPSRNLNVLVPVLERFVEFHQSLNMISPETHKTVLEVIESCRIT